MSSLRLRGHASPTSNAARMNAAAGWLTRLRRLLRRRPLEDVLLDRRLRELDVPALVEHVASLEAELASVQEKLSPPDDRPPGHVLFFAAADGYAIVEA